MISITRRLEFDAGHRIMGHEHHCRFVHGHRYVVEASFSAEALDALGRVVDFGVVKTKLGDWLNENWDHTMILHEQDRQLGESIAAITGQKIFYMPTNPTAENMAQYLLEHICPQLFPESGLQCEKLSLWETPNCRAEVVL